MALGACHTPAEGIGGQIRARIARAPGALIGVAYIESFTTADAMEGDRDGWYDRTGAEYRRLFQRAGLAQCGPYCYTNVKRMKALNEFEICG